MQPQTQTRVEQVTRLKQDQWQGHPRKLLEQQMAKIAMKGESVFQEQRIKGHPHGTGSRSTFSTICTLYFHSQLDLNTTGRNSLLCVQLGSTQNIP